MASFNRLDYQAVFNFAKEAYFLHEHNGKGFDLKAALVMEQIEEVIGHQTGFPVEARRRLEDNRSRRLTKLWLKMGEIL